MGTATAMQYEGTRGNIRMNFLNIGDNKCSPEESRDYITREDLQRYFKAKPGSAYYSDRLFDLMCPTNTNRVNCQEFEDFINEYTSENENTEIDKKIRFLFGLYNNNNPFGLLNYEHIVQMLNASMEENGMKFDEAEIAEMALHLMNEAHGNEKVPLLQPLNLEEFAKLFDNYEELLSNLSTIIDVWRLPLPKKKFSFPVHKLWPRFLKPSYFRFIKNNFLFVIWVAIFVAINCGLFVYKYITFEFDNMYIRLARCAGLCLNFDCCAVLLTMCRYTISLLRSLGLGRVFPVNDQRWFHELSGKVIFLLAILHSVAHVLNIYYVLLPMPVYANWTCLEIMFLPYATNGNTTSDVNFGFVPGCAYSSGVILSLILFVIVTTALPILRENGFFKLFYWTHQIFLPFIIVLWLHCANFYKWIVAPLFVIVVEIGFRIYYTVYGWKTKVSAAVILPSEVVKLVVVKPSEFHFSSGDFVFVKIPLISATEWHPFTISSAPEEPVLTLHIKAVGPWTTRLHNKIQKFGETKDFQVFYFEKQFRLWTCLSILFCCFSKRKRLNCTSVNDSRGSQNQERQYLLIGRSDCDTANSSVGNYQSTCERHSIENVEEEVINDMIAVRYVDSDSSNSRLRKKPNVIKFFNDDASTGISNRTSEIPTSSQASLGSFSVIPESENEVVFRSSGDLSLTITLDGPFGAPTSRIFWERSHAVLIGAGIGVTPCASVLRSIMERHKTSKIDCPECQYSFTHTPTLQHQLHHLKQVDFFWINKEQTSFTWFVDLLYQLEMEQEQLCKDGEKKFLNIHMYMTKALKRNDMKAIGLQLALDLRYTKRQQEQKENDERKQGGKDGRKHKDKTKPNGERGNDKIGLNSLKTRLNAGRPNWDDIFGTLKGQEKGRKIAIFYCGPSPLKKDLSSMCEKYNFDFHPEVF